MEGRGGVEGKGIGVEGVEGRGGGKGWGRGGVEGKGGGMQGRGEGEGRERVEERGLGLLESERCGLILVLCPELQSTSLQGSSLSSLS